MHRSRRTRRILFIALLVTATASAIAIATARAVGGADAEQGSEAPVIRSTDVPQHVSPETVVLDGAAEAEFRQTWTRQASEWVSNTSPDPESAIEAHGRTRFGDGLWWVTTYRNVDGLFCYGERLGYGGQGIGCATTASLFREGPMFVGSGRRQADDPTQWNVFWIYGFTRAPVASVDIVATDCSRDAVSIDSDGVFFHLVGPAKIEHGVWPYRVEARDSQGNLVAAKQLPLDVPDTAAARQAGVQAPSAQNCD